MASNARQESLGYADRGLANPDTSAAEAALKTRLNRKRTKTGCLTCRKRRIKCGEERPVCKNCIKSKRQCEGYNQRVVFKQPTFDYQPLQNGGPHITFQGAPDGGPFVPYDEGFRQVVVDPAFYTQQHSSPVTPYPSAYPSFDQRQQHNNVGAPMATLGGVPYQPQSAGLLNAAYHQMSNGTPVPVHRGQGTPSGDIYSAQTQIFIQPINYTLPSTLPPPPPPALSIPDSAGSQTQPAWQTPFSGNHEQQWPVTSPDAKPRFDRVSPISGVSPRTTNWSQALTPGILSQEPNARTYVPRPELSHPLDVQTSLAATQAVVEAVTTPSVPILQPQTHSPPDFYEYAQPLPPAHTTNHLLSQAAVETQDDDYYDVDEEMDVDTLAVAALDHKRQQSLQRILQVNNISIGDLQTRRYDTFIYDGILDHYRVEDAANPLKNPATARVFAHFISVTAPSLSIFERHPRNTSVLFTDRQIPFSQQGLWTYTMPVAALHHQGLLHSMLALASLHIARLQNASDTPSRQHYAWACKRINNLLGPNSKKRHKTTTIAASMLLGFYEIFTADHRAWNLHLTGSKQLFLETDFLSMSHQLRRMKREKAIRQQVKADPDAVWANIHPQDEMLDQIHDVDEKIISHLIGKPVTYEDDGQVMTPQSAAPPALDLTNFEILRDLYWWYLKQDAYQSIISGNPLLLDYDRWANCPPRAPIGRADAVYGSFDHLILLLGRIAEFACRDRKRKLRQMDANGGEWRPAPGMKMGQKPAAGRSQPNTPLSAHNGQPQGGSYFTGPPQQPQQPPPTAPPQGPLFYGMAPAPRQDVQMPSAYYPANSIPTPQPTSPKEEPDLRAATNAALEEYGRIRAALLEFEHSLGKDFQPLPPEYQVPLETPFGTALTYRSYDISCLWAVYYMCMIITIRSHPHMHPAAHVAAGIAAQETAHYASEIGRINAGIVPGPTDDVPLNPTLGAALWESCITSFFAAIQYRDPYQRRTTVLRIHNIGVRTGWGTAATIANGCETAWVKAAAAGRGPPYTRIARREYSDDPRLSGSSDELDPNGMPNEKDNFDRRLVKTASDARLTWAIGILGSEEDERMKVMT